MIGLDTSAIIDFFKGEASIQALLETTREPLASTRINYLELIWGIAPDKKQHQQEQQYYEQFFDAIHEITLSRSSCQKASLLDKQLKKKGIPIEQFDCLIAAMLLENGIQRIITRNAKHFKHVPGMTVVGY